MPADSSVPPSMQVGKFLEKYGQKELFPIKLHVPLMFTVYLTLQSKCVLNPPSMIRSWQQCLCFECVSFACLLHQVICTYMCMLPPGIQTCCHVPQGVQTAGANG